MSAIGQGPLVTAIGRGGIGLIVGLAVIFVQKQVPYHLGAVAFIAACAVLAVVTSLLVRERSPLPTVALLVGYTAGWLWGTFLFPSTLPVTMDGNPSEVDGGFLAMVFGILLVFYGIGAAIGYAAKRM